MIDSNNNNYKEMNYNYYLEVRMNKLKVI